MLSFGTLGNIAHDGSSLFMELGSTIRISRSSFLSKHVVSYLELNNPACSFTMCV